MPYRIDLTNLLLDTIHVVVVVVKCISYISLYCIYMYLSLLVYGE